MSVLVFGDIMLDKYIDGTVTRISPEAPVPIVQVLQVYNAIGGCGNVSNSIAALEVSNEIISFVGKDENGETLIKLLKKSAIDLHLIKNNLPTITKVRIVSNKHQLLRYDIEEIEAPNKNQLTQVQKLIEKSKAKIAIISDYGKGACNINLCACIINTFNKNNRKVLVDPKSSDWTKYKGAYLISPNFKEFCEAIGKNIINENREIEVAAKKLIHLYNIEYILITRSSKGMSLISKNNILHIPTIANEVFDVTGAGDTVIATIGAMLSKGKSLTDAVLLANKAAAIAIAHFGTYAVAKKELFAK
jgi:rfaE bifunctional protein kinase chain/domain